MKEILEICALVSVSAGTWIVVVLLAKWLKHPLPPVVYWNASTTSGVSTDPSPIILTPPTQEPAKAAPKVLKEPPGLSCGHCGTRNKTDPIRAIVLEKVSYRVYRCLVCKKETLIPDAA